jgi:hypothetical protein
MVGKKSPGMFYFHICVIDIVNDKIIPEGFCICYQDPGILVRRYDPEMANLSLFVLTVSALVRPHKDQVGQILVILVRILDLTYARVVVRKIYQTYKYRESVRIIYMTT